MGFVIRSILGYQTIMFKFIGLVVIGILPVMAQDSGISAERIREHTRFLASDLL